MGGNEGPMSGPVSYGPRSFAFIPGYVSLWYQEDVSGEGE